ncbi:UDP-glucuronic acid decarboxylase family protein [Pseudaminobacter soli (ex Li et al. 2025)]|uniref:NAD-dependent dehydratase n=1 Tax=Pseudaminobacter soli (ex Li et al. 2025) TaxID=1295366 RepID=A0A2P7S1A5_9HYPH|nr:UDP-glucuronic acid decarboxylase family protein [Mesorhizobium soli]PSJ56232.1 NAD-dependent dehydratase [Mesorhizobium soli]
MSFVYSAPGVTRDADVRPKNILVTGGAGFLGSHLCDLLVARGHKVYCVDNFHTGSGANVAGLEATNRFRLVDHDVQLVLPEDLPRFDEIYNFACPASPPHYQSDPVRTAMVNALGAWNVLRRAEADGARVFHASTSEVYGDPEVHPQPESYYGNVNPVGPRSCYDEGKRFAETLFTDYARTHGIVVKMVRIFNTYGPRMRPDDGRVVSNFIVQALRNEPLTIYGDGAQTRSFCYVTDLLRGVDLLMQSGGEVEGPVNLGNPAEIPVGELAAMVIDMVGSRSKIVRLPLPINDPKRRRPDISRAMDLLGWQPEVDLKRGLEKTIEYFADRLPKDMPTEGVTAVTA